MESKVISFRLKKSEYNKLKKLLQKYQTLSQWLRESIEERVKEGK